MAEEIRPGIDDLDRELTPVGQLQARRMAKWLNQRIPKEIRLLSSPALRARQTAAALGQHAEVIATIPPGTTPDILMQSVGWPTAKGTVILVGHQPELGMLASRLLADHALPWALRKGCVWWFRGRERQGIFQVLLKAVVDVDLL